MIAPPDDGDFEALTKSLFLGVARSPLPDRLEALLRGRAAVPSLAALALAAQRARFRAIAAPGVPRGEPLPDDPRPILPQAVRPVLLRLFAGRDGVADDAAAATVLEALARRGWRLHPFDWPRLERLLVKHPRQLGPGERAWLARRSAVAVPEAAAEEIEETNWREFAPAARAGFIRAMRRAAPDRARQLVAEVLPAEPANVRTALLQALAINIGADDREFLEGLAADRARTVREAASELLAHLPGTEAHGALLNDFVSRLTTKRAGLLTRRTALSLEPPANLSNAWQQLEWAARTAGKIGLAPLAAGLGMTETQLVEAAAQPLLIWSLLKTAVAERRLDLTVALAGRVEDADGTLLAECSEFLAALGGRERTLLLEAVFRPQDWRNLPTGAVLTGLREALQAPLAPELAGRLLDARMWREALGGIGSGERIGLSAGITAVATLMPPALRDALREQLRGLPLAETSRALLVLDALDRLEHTPDP